MIAAFVIIVIMAAVAVRLLLLPLKLLFKLGIYALCGLVCLLLLNTVAEITGVFIAINLITILIAGFFGVPGIALLAILEMI